MTMSAPARRILLVLLLLAVMMGADLIVGEMLTSEAEAVRPVIAVIEIREDPQSPSIFQTGNMIWIQSGPSVMDGQGNAVPVMYANVVGTVTVYKVARFLRQGVLVTLTMRTDEADMFFPAQLPVLTFKAWTKIETQAFNMTVSISNMNIGYSTADEFPKKITIEGTWITSASTGTPNAMGTVEPQPIYVRIKPFYYMVMEIDPPMITMSPGQTRVVDLVIRNLGNAHDRYDIDFPNEAALAERGWVVEMNRTSLDVGPMSQGRIRMKVTSPRAFHSPYHMGTSSFMVHALSFNTKQLVDEGELMTTMEYYVDVQVQMRGPDFVYVPAVWAILFFFVMAVVLFNFGINIFTMRRRTFLLPKGKDPGLVHLAKKLARTGSSPRRAPIPSRPERSGHSLFGPKIASTPPAKPAERKPVVDLRSRDKAPEPILHSKAEHPKRLGFGFGRKRSAESQGEGKGQPVRKLNEILEDL